MLKPKPPFWIITEQKHILHPPKHFPCDDPQAPHAFTSGDKLIAFLEARHGGRWNITSVSDEEALIVAIADLHEQGASRICFDPAPGVLPSTDENTPAALSGWLPGYRGWAMPGLNWQ